MRRWHSLLEIIQFPLKMLFVAIILTGLGTLITNQSLSVFWLVNDRNILLLADLFKRTGSFIIVNFPFFVMIKFLATKSNSSVPDYDRNHPAMCWCWLLRCYSSRRACRRRPPRRFWD